MKTEERSTRELALEWWNDLNQEKQIDLQYIHKSPCRHPLNAVGLTGREIEEIWRKETKDGSDREIIEEVFPDLKSNQKQFKEFNPELFKAYIDKFSDEDKIKAFNILISFENVKWYMIEELSK